MAASNDYVLGTHDQEIERLGLQHRAWRQRALDSWRLAGIGPGSTVIDVGCGPGFAALDLAELVGPSGRIVAVDKSERFLQALEAMRRERGIENITLYSADLEAGEFPNVTADYAWARWIFAFVKNPEAVLAKVAAGLPPNGAPGVPPGPRRNQPNANKGAIILHEYFDYSTWRAAPQCPELDEFVGAVMASWRDSGGEPNIALCLPGWLQELGFEIRVARPVVDLVQPDSLSWKWLAAFVEVGRSRLVEMGYLSPSRSESIWQAFVEFQSSPGARLITPGVLEIIAIRSG